MKVFISQPMNNLTEEEVMKVRENAITYIKNNMYRIAHDLKLPISCDIKTIEVIDQYHMTEDCPENPSRLYCLGRSIQMMEEADLVFFTKDSYNSKGCRAEYLICMDYGIPMVCEYESTDKNFKITINNIMSWLNNKVKLIKNSIPRKKANDDPNKSYEHF